METTLEYEGLKFKIFRGVYEPSDDSYLLAENLKVESGDFVLEIGTGSGFISLLAAQVAKKVVATDISPLAIECVKYNVELNHFTEKIEIRQGNLFNPLLDGEKFDLIIFNPPYLPESNEKKKEDQTDWYEKSWNGGQSGRDLIDPFIKNCRDFLNPRGRIQMIQSSLSNVTKSRDLFIDLGFEVAIAAEASFFFEKIVLLDAVLKK